jgi:hypothetical protein
VRKFSDEIRLIYVVVNKKSNVEVYAQGFYEDSYKNVVPGTVVDTFITSPKNDLILNEFFLVSTSQKFGFPCPTKYSVIYDSI